MFIFLFSSFVFCTSLTKPHLFSTCDGSSRCSYESDTVSIESTEFRDFSSETAEQQGGAVYLQYCVFTCKNTAFVNCSCQTQGGAIYYYNQGKNGKSSEIDGCTFSYCSAPEGGAAYLYQSKHETHEVKNCLFQHNEASTQGGALYFDGQSATIQNCTFNNNSSPNGAAVSLRNTCQASFTWENSFDSCVFMFTPSSDNSILVYVDGSSKLNPVLFSNCCFVSNGTMASDNYFLSSDNPVTFDGYNNVNGPESTIKATISVTGYVEYNAVNCTIKTIPTPTPSATLPPTASPAPTSTPRPTASLAPTLTPRPTASLAPTSTTGPTASSVPTGIPVPTQSYSPSSSFQPIPTQSFAPLSPTITTTNTNTDNEGEDGKQEYEKSIKKMYLTIGGVVGGGLIIVIALLVVITLLLKKRKVVYVNMNSQLAHEPPPI